MKRTVLVSLAAVILLGGASYGADVNFSGLVQTRYVDVRDEDATFFAKAARLGARVNVTDKVSVEAMFELAGEPNMLEAVVDYALPWGGLHAMVGQFKLPFGFETQISRFDLEAMDRSLVISHLWYNGVSHPYLRDVGAQIAGRYKIFEYKLGAVNGVGYNYTPDPDGDGMQAFPSWGRDNNNSKDIVGRIGAGIPMFAGLGFSLYEGKWPVDYSPQVCNENRSAKALDIFLDTGKMLFQYEHVWAQGRLSDAGIAAPGGLGAGSALPSEWQGSKYGGYYIVLGYRVNALIEPVFKVDMCDPDKDTDTDRLKDTYLGVNLNFERKARFQVFYRESKVAGRFDDSAFLAQASARF
ncbi:MAG: hypothetical protein ABIJ00_07965 [Candidatus Eisenbacteria bacterium]